MLIKKILFIFFIIFLSLFLINNCYAAFSGVSPQEIDLSLFDGAFSHVSKNSDGFYLQDNVLTNCDRYFIMDTGSYYVLFFASDFYYDNDNGNIYYSINTLNYFYYEVDYNGKLTYGRGVDNRASSTMWGTLIYSSHSIYYKDGSIFFSVDSPLVEGMKRVEMKAVTKEILGLLPVILSVLVSLVALRKGLQVLSNTLHKA